VGGATVSAVADEGGEPEVTEFDVATARDEDILGLYEGRRRRKGEEVEERVKTI